eukprot:4617931-Pleurochrysis_carterae.AAC.1
MHDKTEYNILWGHHVAPDKNVLHETRLQGNSSLQRSMHHILRDASNPVHVGDLAGRKSKVLGVTALAIKDKVVRVQPLAVQIVLALSRVGHLGSLLQNLGGSFKCTSLEVVRFVRAVVEEGVWFAIVDRTLIDIGMPVKLVGGRRSFEWKHGSGGRIVCGR